MIPGNSSSDSPLQDNNRMWARIAAAVSLLWFVTVLITPAAGGDKEKPPFPDVRIPGFARNEHAIQALGDKLASVAAWYGKDSDQLAGLLRHDRTLWVSPSGRLMYACELETPIAAEAAAGSPTIVQAGSFPLDQTFKLHSSPGSSKVIYLDFNGQVVSGTAWNASNNGGADIIAAPFSLDSDPATFNTTELLMIQNIWKRVAEDYSPFDVDITTEEPAADALARTSSSDSNYGIRVVITPTNFYPNAGGVSYVGVFDAVGEYYKTSWVFSNMLANGEKYIAEACSHESGHAVGLSHEGKTDGTVYYQGQGNWAPIMGNSYYKNVTQWCKGEYAGANNTEDQLQVIQSNGLAYYPDDHGNTAATATALTGATGISGSGFIERNSDVDVFKFLTGAGNVVINISPAPFGPNLDIKAELRDSNWNPVASSDPADLGASINAAVTSPGTYYLAVSGTGSGDPLTTGYSSYGSLGQYTFTGTIVDPGTLKPPVAAASASSTSGNAPLAVSFSSAGSTDAPGVITSYSWDFGDGSARSSDPNPSHTYLVAGTFTATLTVTDNDSLTASASVTVSVRRDLLVDSISITPQSSTSAVWAAVKVTVKDLAGSPVAGATVNGTWSGVISGSATGNTDSIGAASFTSSQSSTGGTLTFTVTSVSAPGYTYNATLNRQTSASATASLAVDPFGAPSNLQASAGKSQITLRWKDNSTTETNFEIERSPRGASTFVSIKTLPNNTVTFTDSGLPKGAFYDYRVRATKAGACTGYSNTATARVK